MSIRRAREFSVFSMSFLDTICCAFGAVILLFVLSKFGEPQAHEKARQDLSGRVLALQKELEEIRGTTEVLNRELKSRQSVMSEEELKVARLRGELSALRGKYRSSKQESEVANDLEGQLVAAQEQLTAEQKRLLGSYKRPTNSAVGGIPVDSEYIIFIIDTSGSMFNYVWPTLLRKITETLDIYPQVKGFQVMNDEGVYMFPSFKGKWLPDTPQQRKRVIDRLRDWNAFSNSSPVEGIVEAIRTYHSQEKKLKISLYVFGDEFTGSSIDQVLKTVDFMNREDRTGERRVRIHAVGFPVRPDAPQYTSIRFATLMRILCQRNGGTFVGIEKS
jgi:hypothetical protein